MAVQEKILKQDCAPGINYARYGFLFGINKIYRRQLS